MRLALPYAEDEIGWHQKNRILDEAVRVLARRGVSVTTESEESALLYSK